MSEQRLQQACPACGEPDYGDGPRWARWRCGLRLRLFCWWHGHTLTPPYRYRQQCGHCGRSFGSMDPPENTDPRILALAEGADERRKQPAIPDDLAAFESNPSTPQPTSGEGPFYEDIRDLGENIRECGP